MNKPTIPASDKAWEDGLLGQDERYVGVAPAALTKSADEAAGTVLVSIRMQKSMIDDLRAIAAASGGLGYQTLIKQQLQRFIDAEKHQLWSEFIAQKLRPPAGTSKKRPSRKESKPRRAG